MSISPSPASAAKKTSSGDQVESDKIIMLMVMLMVMLTILQLADAHDGGHCGDEEGCHYHNALK